MKRGAPWTVIPFSLVAAVASLGGNEGYDWNVADVAFENLFGGSYIQLVQLHTMGSGKAEKSLTVQIVRSREPKWSGTLIRVLEPPALRETAALVLGEGEGRLDSFLYLPAFKKVRRIASGQVADSLFGTELSYQDLDGSFYQGAKRTLIGWNDEASCEEISIVPSSGSSSRHSRVAACVDKSAGVFSWLHFFGESAVNKRLVLDRESLLAVGRRTVALRLDVGGARRDHVTRMVIEKHAELEKVPKGIFTVRNLEGGSARGDREMLSVRLEDMEIKP